MRKKDLEDKIKNLQEIIYENNFFLRYLVVSLEKYQEDPTTAIHDYTCSLNHPENFETHKAYNPQSKNWEHHPDYVNQLCDCKIRAIINTIYEIKQYQKDKTYTKLINDIKKHKEQEIQKKANNRAETNNIISDQQNIVNKAKSLQ